MDFDSDKFYWHRYVPTYESAFAALGDVRSVFEYGVAWGGSIRWLAERFPDARIVGADITPIRPEWPQSDRIAYVQLDQGNRSEVAERLRVLGRRYDLIIDDGSHFPRHQAICLTESLQWLRSGGLYILEDIHKQYVMYQARPLHSLIHARPGTRSLPVGRRRQGPRAEPTLAARPDHLTLGLYRAPTVV